MRSDSSGDTEGSSPRGLYVQCFLGHQTLANALTRLVVRLQVCYLMPCGSEEMFLEVISLAPAFVLCESADLLHVLTYVPALNHRACAIHRFINPHL